MTIPRDKGLSRYYDRMRAEVAHFVPESCRTLLDVGCGKGEFGAGLKQSRPQLTVWGVELVPAVAAEARKRLDTVITGDALTHLEELPDGYFDCIAFNDSLEHMIDPYVLLARIKSKLSPSGVIVSSIPNVRYYRNLQNLLFKKQWRYEDAGILDRTHLRFFTERSIRDMYASAGYTVDAMEGINATKKLKVRQLIALSFGWLEDIRYQQFVTVARPQNH